MNKSRKTLVVMAIVAAMPVLLSYILYHWWQPSSQMNHGQLLETRNAQLNKLLLTNGNTVSSAFETKKWVLLTVQSASCDARCQHKLYLMRQVRAAQNANMSRIDRVWLVTGTGHPEPAVLSAHPGLHTVRTDDPTWIKLQSAESDPGAHIYLIDPLGNFVLRYDDKSEPSGMLKDLGRLLKYSTIG